MSEQPSSRERILQAIQTALASPNSRLQTSDQLHRRWAGTHAQPPYERAGSLSREARLDLFVERTREYETDVHRCASAAELLQTLHGILAQRYVQTIALPPAFPSQFLPPSPLGSAPIHWLRDDPPLTNARLDSVDGVLTLATVAVAVSGSIALQHGPTEGRRVLTLLPDFHVCIVRAGQVVETLPEALDRLHPTAAQNTTFFSGPSATADIEMTRIKGVHGPRFLCVLLLEEDQPCTP